jgi:ATP-dependent Clp endopeptidase proteolytic subunit ClpP
MRKLRMTNQPKKIEASDEVAETPAPKKEEQDKSAMLQALLSEEDDFYAFTLIGDIEEKTSNEVISTLISMHHTIDKKQQAKLEEQIVQKTAEVEAAAEGDEPSDLDFVIEQEEPPEIKMYISTAGGAADDMFAMYDVMKWVQRSVDISTIGIGKVMSAGVPLLAAGTKGKRYLAENARIMIHNASAGAAGIIPTMEEEINEFKNIQDMYIRLLSENTNMSEKKIRSMLKKKANIYLSAKQAIELGIADHIL